MRPVHALALRATSAAHQASRAAITYRIASERAKLRADKARDTLAAAVQQCGLTDAQAITVRAAAESYAKALAVLIPVSVQAEPDPDAPHPLAESVDSEGGEL